MRCLVQRVRSAKVEVSGEQVGNIGNGIVALVCAMRDDIGNEKVARMARKLVNLRIFRDSEGRLNRSLKDVRGSALIISQFTLAADTSKGNRPGLSDAADPVAGERLYNCLSNEVRNLGVHVENGVFGTEMLLSLENDGPVTIWLET